MKISKILIVKLTPRVQNPEFSPVFCIFLKILIALWIRGFWKNNAVAIHKATATGGLHAYPKSKVSTEKHVKEATVVKQNSEQLLSLVSLIQQIANGNSDKRAAFVVGNSDVIWWKCRHPSWDCNNMMYRSLRLCDLCNVALDSGKPYPGVNPLWRTLRSWIQSSAEALPKIWRPTGSIFLGGG